jgi:hypothetical protein
MVDIFIREMKVRKCIADLNPGGWMRVSETVRILRRLRDTIRSSNLEAVADFTLFPKQRMWYFGMQCSQLVLTNLIQAVLEFIFDVDMIKSPCEYLVFSDAEGTMYWVSDLWFVIMDSDNLCAKLRLDEEDVGRQRPWPDMADRLTGQNQHGRSAY